MENYNLNNIMAHISRIDVQGKMVQNRDVSLFVYLNFYFKLCVEFFRILFVLSSFMFSNLSLLSHYQTNITFAKM